MILEIRRGVAKHRERKVTEPVFLVGSNPDCDMVLGDPQFAPIHFYLLRRAGRTCIRSTETDPDLTVNGQVKRVAQISEGDRIRTGPYEFIVRAAS